MAISLTRIKYDRLNPRQKENYNFLKVSAVLADYGFMTMRVSADWQGADFIAQHTDGKTFLKVQLKPRLAFRKTYQGKELYITFSDKNDWYLYPHDKLLKRVLRGGAVKNSDSWKLRGGYSFPKLSASLRKLLKPYKICGTTQGEELPE